MAAQMERQEKRARRKATERVRRAVAVAVATEDVEEHVPEVVVTTRTMPRIVSVYRGPSVGQLYHARCDRELIFVGMRGGIELDFYCLDCREHISLPEAALPRVPIGK